MQNRSEISKAKRWVVKIGSSVLYDKKGRVSSTFFNQIARQISWLRSQSIEVILVSSGAIACGLKKMDLKKVPEQIHKQQALAALGQSELMQRYEKALSRKNLVSAQLLLNRSDLENRKRYLNAKHTLLQLLKYDAIPIINENDTVSVDEIKVGDNDNLAALVASLLDADLLVLLTDIDALYTADPKIDSSAEPVRTLRHLDKKTFASATGTLRAGSTGGMQTKLEAAVKACHFNIATVIAQGQEKNLLKRLYQAEELGTLVLPKARPEEYSAKQHWILHALRPKGVLHLDMGAKQALVKKKSLLPSGIKSVDGNFRIGDAVDIYFGKQLLAKGLSSYSAVELRKILGKKSSEITSILGYKYADEIIHKDNMVLI